MPDRQSISFTVLCKPNSQNNHEYQFFSSLSIKKICYYHRVVLDMFTVSVLGESVLNKRSAERFLVLLAHCYLCTLRILS